ncbi:MAG: STAS domain-containing protein [Actinobacteria bacterium]|nr:MAG: STAS domain-containing protein [Actinomycetota bacterium]
MEFEAPNFDLSEDELDDETVVLRVAGEIHATTAPEFSERLNDAIASGKTGVVLDLTGVEFIDSTGLSVLLNGLRRVTRVRGTMVLACANPTVLRLFEITKLDSTFEILPNCDDAIERLRQVTAD